MEVVVGFTVVGQKTRRTASVFLLGVSGEMYETFSNLKCCSGQHKTVSLETCYLRATSWVGLVFIVPDERWVLTRRFHQRTVRSPGPTKIPWIILFQLKVNPKWSLVNKFLIINMTRFFVIFTTVHYFTQFWAASHSMQTTLWHLISWVPVWISSMRLHRQRFKWECLVSSLASSLNPRLNIFLAIKKFLKQQDYTYDQHISVTCFILVSNNCLHANLQPHIHYWCFCERGYSDWRG